LYFSPFVADDIINTKSLIIFFYIFVVIAAFGMMEFVAWATHKYLMHGLLWSLHKDHHKGGYHPFQKNDIFFLVFAIPSWLCIMLGSMHFKWWVVAIGVGIFLYGWCYFLVHDVFIHQRFKWLRMSNNRYAKMIRRAHKLHHKNINKEKGELFGLLLVPRKYWNTILQDDKKDLLS